MRARVQDVIVGGYVDDRQGAVLSVGYGDQQLIRHLTPGEALLIAHALANAAQPGTPPHPNAPVVG